MSTTDKELTYVVTEEEYKEGLAKGWDDDDMLKPGTYKVRRPKWAEKLRANKVKVSIYLDKDIVEHFRERAEQPNAAPYQTQINNELRNIMENGSAETAMVERDLLNDKKFLKALKEKLEQM
ncbi:MAG: BrnA antitoxin family protein [Pyrinomonadaceae bacterium]|nr:BrnA antitoxin family protein [Pyrinomonadaceae bacterium]